MTESERRTITWAPVLQLVLLAFAAWFLFSLTPPGHRVEDAIRVLLPRWYVAANLALVPALLGLSIAPGRLSFGVRIILFALATASAVVAEIAARVFVAGYCAMLGVVLLEAYWLMPKWNARNRRAR